MLSDVQSSNPTKISLNIITATTTIFITRMHSSKMRTARSNSRQVCGGGFCLGACLDTPPPGCGPGAPPPGVGLETVPWPDPSSSPLGVGLETCKACWDTPSRDLQGMLGYHLQGMLGYHAATPHGQTDTCKNITFANFVCGR